MASIAGPLLAGAIITVSATPALAAVGITSPTPGATVTGGSGVLVSAQVDGLLTSGKLMLRGPADQGFTTVDSGHGTLSYRLPLGGGEPARNGRYTVRLDAGLLVLQGTAGERSFTVRVPPQRPTDVSASVRSDRRIRVQWDRGAEPDLASYDVLTSSGRVLRSGLSVGRICGASLCAATVTVPSSVGSGQIGVTVRAHRHIAPGSSRTLASGRSAADMVMLAGSSPSPSPNVSASGNSPSASPTVGASSSPSSSPSMRPLSSNSPTSEAKSPTGTAGPVPPLGPGAESQNPSFSAPLPQFPSEGSGGGEASGPGTTWTAVTDAAKRWKTAAIIVIVLLVAAHLGGLHLRGRTRAVPRSRRTATGGSTAPTPATAAGAAGTGYLTAAAAEPTTEPSRRRSTRPLRRVRSLVGAYRGSRRRID